MKSVADRLKEIDYKKSQGEWIPASGGAETPFMTRSGRRLMYCFQPSSGKHAYLDCDNDIILTFDEACAYMGYKV